MNCDLGLLLVIILTIRLIVLSNFVSACAGRIVPKPISAPRATSTPLIFLLKFVAHGLDILIDLSCNTVDARLCELDTRARGREVGGLAGRTLEAASCHHNRNGCPFDEVVRS